MSYIIQLSPEARQRAEDLRQGIIRIPSPEDSLPVPTPAPIVKAKPVVRVEIARSFSYKLNAGAGTYESRDFFCSEKAECAIEDQLEVSAALFAFCRQQVLLSVKQYIDDMNAQRSSKRA